MSTYFEVPAAYLMSCLASRVASRQPRLAAWAHCAAQVGYSDRQGHPRGASYRELWSHVMGGYHFNFSDMDKGWCGAARTARGGRVCRRTAQVLFAVS
jgi:hypothetical protein